MRTDLFITYPINSYFTAHVLEELIGFELYKDGKFPNRLTIGAGYIHAQWNKVVELPTDDNGALKRPIVSKEMIGLAQHRVASEIATNLNRRPAVDLFNFNDPSVPDILSIISTPISKDQIASLLDTIYNHHDIVVTRGESYAVKRKTNDRSYYAPSQSFPLFIYGRDPHYAQLNFATSAKNIFDGYLIEAAGATLVDGIRAAGINEVSYETHFRSDHRLNLVFNVPRENAEQAYDIITQIANDRVFPKPITDDEFGMPYDNEMQHYDYGVVMSANQIRSRLDMTRGFTLRQYDSNIIVDEVITWRSE